MTVPSLHEIAAMPFPASQIAMRQHYNPDWGKPIEDEVEAPRLFEVYIDYEYTKSDTDWLTVEAWSEAEAIERATASVANECDADDFDVLSTKVKPIEREGAHIDIPFEAPKP